MEEIEVEEGTEQWWEDSWKQEDGQSRGQLKLKHHVTLSLLSQFCSLTQTGIFEFHLKRVN